MIDGVHLMPVAPLARRAAAAVSLAFKTRWTAISIATVLVASTLVRWGPAATVNVVQAAPNPIVVENQQPGTDQWQLGRPGFRTADDVNMAIKGFASATSVNKGEAVTFYVSVAPAQAYTIDVYRMGWYGGLGGRLLQHIDGLNGVQQPTCPTDASTGLISCPWSAGYTLNVPTSWTTGIYMALLTNAQNYQNYIVFVVRDDGRVADLIYQEGANTSQAYNNFPDDNLTGKSLYHYNSNGAPTVAGGPQAVKVSFDRPYADNGAGQFLDFEVYLVHWVERSGYDVSYTTDVDTHVNGSRLRSYKGFLSGGHDEYWTKAMYDAVTAARDGGVHLAFFVANAIYWQVRLEPSGSGVANRVVVCYRDATLDPIADPSLKTVTWRESALARPEQGLLGVQYTSQVQGGINVPYVVTNSGNWVYAGTGFHDGDSVPRIMGYEADRSMPNYPLPAFQGQSYTLLSRSPYTNSDGQADFANSSIYQAPSGAWVFDTGTSSWSWGLDRQSYVDVRIQKTTANVLNRFLGITAAPTSLRAARSGTAR